VALAPPLGLAVQEHCAHAAEPAWHHTGANFCVRYPKVTVEVVAEDRAVYLVQERYDAAIPITQAPTAAVLLR